MSNPLQDSDTLLRAMIENLPGGAMFVVDAELRYRIAGGEALATAGFKPEDFVGRTIFEALPPELAASYEPMYRQALAGKPFEHEHNAHVRGASPQENRTYISQGTPLRSVNGEVYGVMVVSYDITERKRVEDERKHTEVALRESEARLQSVANLVPDLLWDSEPDGSTNWYNQRWMEYTGQTFEQAIGWGWVDAIHPDDREESARHYREAVEQGMPLQQEHRIRRHDGAYRWFVVKASPLKDERGKVIKMYGAATDIHDRKQTEITLRESEEKYRSIFDSIDEGFCIYELIDDDDGKPIDLRWVEVNLAYEKQTGLKDTVGKRHSDLSLNTESYWFEIYDRVTKTGEAADFENWHEPTGRWYRVFASRLGSVGSRQVAVVFEDISDRKHREANLTFLADLMNDFAPLATAEEVMEIAGKRITEHLDLSRYMFVEIFPEAGTCTYLLPSHPPGQLEISGSFVLADYHTEAEHRLLCTGHSMIVNDIRDGTRTPEQIAAFEMFDIASIVNTPYLSNGRWVFDLGVARSKPSVWREDEIELLRELSARIWLRIERARAEASLRQSEAKYRSLFESIDEGFNLLEMIADESGHPSDFRIVETNPAWEQQTGLTDATGKTLLEIAPNFEQQWFDFYSDVVLSGRGRRTEYYTASVDRWYTVYASPIGGEGSRQVAVVFNDITERKQAEAQLRRAAELNAFRVKLSDALRPLSDPTALQETAMQVLGTHLGVNRAFYGEVLDDDDTLVIGPGYANELFPIVGQIKFSEFDSDLLTDYRAGRTVVINDLYVDVQLSAKAKTEFDAIQVRAAVGVALVKNEKVQAILSIHQSVPRQWTSSEIALLEETADRTWNAVQRARAEAALRESEIQRIREQAAREEERQRAEALAELDRAKTLFFSNISHEFRTPLTLSLAPLQDVLSDSTLPSDQRERLELVHRNNLRLLKLVNTLLDFSRIEAGRIEAVYEPTDLATYTAELASVFRSAIERAGLQLIVDCPPLPEPVFVDREMWEKIVLNLLSNAFKFTFEGEITVSLKAESNIGLQAATSNLHRSPSASQSTSSDLETTTSKPGTLTSELETSPSELNTSTPELETSSSELETSPSELNTSTPELETSSSELGTLTPELETSCLELGISPSQLKPQPSTLNPSQFAILEIHDTGTGIAPEHLPHLFERFYQVRGSQARTHEGSGIGLALVHELVRLHGGTIKVSSTVGEGTCFTIALPFGTDHLPSDRLLVEGDRYPVRTLASTAMGATAYVEEAERWLPLQTSEVLKTSEVFAASRVLLVDDNADMREYLTHILSEHVQVEAVADGAMALAAVQTRVPDLILSDVMMPGLDGFELLEVLRADARTREIPIILLSAHAGEEAIVEGLEAGADDYLIKPFSAQELISRVNAHLQMAQLRGAALQEARTNIRRRDEMISTVSHELNAPLVSILGWTRLLQSNPPSPAILKKALDTIERNATLQAKLVQDLLDISRITVGNFRLNPQAIELKPVIETAIATVTQSAADKGIHLTWQENVAEPVVVMGDSDRLGQVLINLLTNAVKFTPESGRVEISLSLVIGHWSLVEEKRLSTNDKGLMPSDHYAEIRVTDTGIGIVSDFLPYVFDRFRQAEGAHSVKGLGLGLAIARHIVELHNGTIHAESAGEEQGATFTVRLPLL